MEVFNVLRSGAGGENRTLVTSLENWDNEPLYDTRSPNRGDYKVIASKNPPSCRCSRQAGQGRRPVQRQPGR